jgi:hypothetical protein
LSDTGERKIAYEVLEGVLPFAIPGRLDIFGSVFTIPSRPHGEKRGAQFGMKSGARLIASSPPGKASTNISHINIQHKYSLDHLYNLQ